MRTADHACVEHPGVRAQDRLHLVRVDVRAAPDDDVFHPPRDVQVAGLIDKTEVAHVNPAVVRVRPERLSPVPFLDQVAPHADLAVDDLPFGVVVRPADAGPPRRLRIGRPRDGELARVHRAVEARDWDASRDLPPLRNLWGKGCAGDRHCACRGQRDSVSQHADHVGRHTDQQGRAGRARHFEAVLGCPLRLVEHDQRSAGAKAVQAHAADALRQRRHGEDAIVFGDLEPSCKALEGHLLQPRRQRRELGHPRRARGQRYLHDPARIRSRGGGCGQTGRRGGRQLVRHVGIDHQGRPRLLCDPSHLVLAQTERERQQDGAEVWDGEL